MVIGIIIWIVSVILNIWVTVKKYRQHPVLWIILGIIFSWITLIVNLCKAPDRF